MTKKEAIAYWKQRSEHIHNWLEENEDVDFIGEYVEAIDLAIKALQEPKTIIGIDIPYESDKGIATIFTGNEKMVLEEIKEIMSVVRCKDCKWELICRQTVEQANTDEIEHRPLKWCSYGKRRIK